MRAPLLAFSALLAFASPTTAQQAARTLETQKAKVTIETVARGLDQPWGIAFLPDGRMLVTERPGRIRLIGADGTLSAPLSGIPTVAARGQGGLLDIVADPNFATNRHVYVSYAEARAGGAATSVSRLRLNTAATGFDQQEVIFRQEPVGSAGQHFGARLVFDRAGALFVTLGDRGNLRMEAQNPASTVGKVVRITPAGQPAEGNPKREGWAANVWSVGHRNVQGAALHPGTGKLWTAEHGARGGDEINIPAAGRNYGWPVITYGRDYSGIKIGEGTEKPGLEQPVYYWDPSIAPSGMAFYTADRIPGWKGSLFVGGLAGRLVARLTLDGEKVVAEERLFETLNKRIRDVRQGPDGALYLVTGEPEGEVLRVR